MREQLPEPGGRAQAVRRLRRASCTVGVPPSPTASRSSRRSANPASARCCSLQQWRAGVPGSGNSPVLARMSPAALPNPSPQRPNYAVASSGRPTPLEECSPTFDRCSALPFPPVDALLGLVARPSRSDRRLRCEGASVEAHSTHEQRPRGRALRGPRAPPMASPYSIQRGERLWWVGGGGYRPGQRIALSTSAAIHSMVGGAGGRTSLSCARQRNNCGDRPRTLNNGPCHPRASSGVRTRQLRTSPSARASPHNRVTPPRGARAPTVGVHQEVETDVGLG